ncbi:MAG TPA: hypothetical protein VMJ65_08560, partial [Solirubrobacteraceae bacterium]|nr:hypothetical protein [Solirubrobacteraceae bacterium]
ERRGPRIAVAALVAAVAAAVGFVVAPGSDRAPAQSLSLSQTASTDRLSISYPVSWRQATTAQPVAASLKLSSPVVLAPRGGGGGALIVGTTAAVDSTLLPKGFGATLLTGPQGADVRLGAQTFRRYLNLLPRGAATTETVYALPTNAGTVIASCVAPSADAPRFASACEHAVASLRLRSAAALSLTANPAFARSLGTIIGALNSARTTDARSLDTAKRPAAQAAAARRLSSAHAAAAAAAARLTPGPIGADGNLAIVAALHKLSAGYASLARAAQANDKRRYTAATTVITQADAALDAGFARLRQDGYSIG